MKKSLSFYFEVQNSEQTIQRKKNTPYWNLLNITIRNSTTEHARRQKEHSFLFQISVDENVPFFVQM